MSRIYEAKQRALAAHPKDRESGIDLFVLCCGMDQADIEYEIGESCEEYTYGNRESAELKLITEVLDNLDRVQHGCYQLISHEDFNADSWVESAKSLIIKS